MHGRPVCTNSLNEAVLLSGICGSLTHSTAHQRQRCKDLNAHLQGLDHDLCREQAVQRGSKAMAQMNVLLVLVGALLLKVVCCCTAEKGLSGPASCAWVTGSWLCRASLMFAAASGCTSGTHHCIQSGTAHDFVIIHIPCCP